MNLGKKIILVLLSFLLVISHSNLECSTSANVVNRLVFPGFCITLGAVLGAGSGVVVGSTLGGFCGYKLGGAIGTTVGRFCKLNNEKTACLGKIFGCGAGLYCGVYIGLQVGLLLGGIAGLSLVPM